MSADPTKPTQFKPKPTLYEYESKHSHEGEVFPTFTSPFSSSYSLSPLRRETTSRPSLAQTPLEPEDLKQLATIFKTKATPEACFDAVYQACKNRNWQPLKRGGSSLDNLLSKKGFPLLIALINARTGNLLILKLLIKNKGNPQLKDYKGRTPLEWVKQARRSSEKRDQVIAYLEKL